MGIYSYELFNVFGVENIIRIGSCGALSERVRIRDIIIGMGACTNSNFASQYRLNGTFAPICDFELMSRAVSECERLGARFHVGNIVSTDTFYSADQTLNAQFAGMGVLRCGDGGGGALHDGCLQQKARACNLHGVRSYTDGRGNNGSRAGNVLYTNDGGRAENSSGNGK